MIVCPNCNHSNPEGATQCEACYTPLPANIGTMSCPNCGTSVQIDASFCGQCGFNLRSQNTPTVAEPMFSGDMELEIPEQPVSLEPLVQPEPLIQPDPAPIPSTLVSSSSSSPPVTPEAESAPEPTSQPSSVASPVATNSKTQLQQQKAILLHVQTNTLIELPPSLSVIHMGKPNERIPPDIDVSGFPNSEIVSRIHSDIRVEGDAYYIEDVGSSNGTYINNLPLVLGNRHRLRPGDRIALGKGDLVSFIFQLS